MAKNHSIQRIRLIESEIPSLPVGTLGICMNTSADCSIVYWQTGEWQIVNHLWTDTFHAEPIIDRCQLLTMHDVLNLSYGNDEEIFNIQNPRKVKRIFHEYQRFIAPLRQMGEQKKILN